MRDRAPEAMIAVMGPEAAVNAVFARKIDALPEEEREAYIEQKRTEFRADIDVYRLASELIVDDIVTKEELRDTLIRRFKYYATKEKALPPKKAQRHPSLRFLNILVWVLALSIFGSVSILAPVFAEEPEEILVVADAHYYSGDYYRSITEYQRIFGSTSDRSAPVRR